MATQVKTTRRSRLPLSRDRILRTAMAVADEAGIDSVTMRRLGQAVGVEAMSLYNHVANKNDLLGGLVDLVLSEIDLPSDAENWELAIREHAISTRAVLRRHPWACNLMMSVAAARPARIRHIDWLLRRLREAGFSAETTFHAYHVLDSHTLGYTLWEQAHTMNADAAREIDVGALLRELHLERYPHFAEHVDQHFGKAGPISGSAFELGLDLILDGLRRIRTPGEERLVEDSRRRVHQD